MLVVNVEGVCDDSAGPEKVSDCSPYWYENRVSPNFVLLQKFLWNPLQLKFGISTAPEFRRILLVAKEERWRGISHYRLRFRENDLAVNPSASSSYYYYLYNAVIYGLF